MVKHNVTVEDSSPLVTYPQSGLWQDSPHTADFRNYSGYTPFFQSSHRTNASATAEFSFNGTGVYVFGTKGPTGSTYNITLSPASPNLTAPPGTSGPATFVGTSKAPKTVYQQLLFASTALNASTPHHLEIGNYGFGEFILDFIIVESEVNGTSTDVKGKGNATAGGESVRKIKVDDSSSAFEYRGSGWTSDVSGNMLKDLLSNETQHSTSDSGASVLFQFRGSGVELHGQYSSGAFLAQLDDWPVVPVNASYQRIGSKTPNRPRELLFFADGLKEDNHQLLVTNQGGSDANGLSVDFAVVSTTDPDNMTGSSTAADTVRATKSPSHSVPVSAIVGGVVGVLALLVLAVLGMWYLRVYRRRRTSSVRAIDLNDEGDAGFDVEKAAPWDMQPPPPHPFLLSRPASPDRRERPLPPVPELPVSRSPSEPSDSTMPSPPPEPPPPNSPNVHYLSPNEMHTSLDAFAVRQLLVQAMRDAPKSHLPASPRPPSSRAPLVSLSRYKSDARSSYSLPSARQSRFEPDSRLSHISFPMPPPRSQYESKATLRPAQALPEHTSYLNYYLNSPSPQAQPPESPIRHEDDAGFSLDYMSLPPDSSIPPPTPARTSFRRSSLLPPMYDQAWFERISKTPSFYGDELLTPRTKSAFRLAS